MVFPPTETEKNRHKWEDRVRRKHAKLCEKPCVPKQNPFSLFNRLHWCYFILKLSFLLTVGFIINFSLSYQLSINQDSPKRGCIPSLNAILIFLNTYLNQKTLTQLKYTMAMCVNIRSSKQS